MVCFPPEGFVFYPEHGMLTYFVFPQWDLFVAQEDFCFGPEGFVFATRGLDFWHRRMFSAPKEFCVGPKGFVFAPKRRPVPPRAWPGRPGYYEKQKIKNVKVSKMAA